MALVKIKLTYHYPESAQMDDEGNDIKDEYGNTVYDYNEGSYGVGIISLTNPGIGISIRREENWDMILYLELIEGALGYFGDGPYDLDQLESEEVVSELSEQYSEDCRTADAYLTMSAEYLEWDEDPVFQDVSEKLRVMEIPGVSTLKLLRLMDKEGIV